MARRGRFGWDSPRLRPGRFRSSLARSLLLSINQFVILLHYFYLFHSTLPHVGPIAALKVHPSGQTLLVALASNAFFLYDLKERKIAEWSASYAKSIPKPLRKRTAAIEGVAFDPAPNDDTLVLYGADFLFRVNLTVSFALSLFVYN